MGLWRSFVPKERTRLGEVLVMMGASTKPEIDNALATQKEQHERLGAILIAGRLLRPTALRTALRLQKKLRNGGAADAMLEIVEARTAEFIRRRKAHEVS